MRVKSETRVTRVKRVKRATRKVRRVTRVRIRNKGRKKRFKKKGVE